MELQLSERARRALSRLRPESDLAESIEAIALDALRMRLRECVEKIGGFEARYGRGFEQFAADWSSGRLANRSSHPVERDYMEWEALTIERQELLDLVHEFAGPSRADI